MIFKQFYLPCLAHASYFIGDQEAWHGNRRMIRNGTPTNTFGVVVEHALKIKHVLLTHLHADFVAGHLELRDRGGLAAWESAKLPIRSAQI